MIHPKVAPYLAPYHRAACRYGGEFGSLCWTSLYEQTARFEAMIQVYDFSGKCVVDAGCGRADFYDFLVARGIMPSYYVGIEAIGPLVEHARLKSGQILEIIQADFLLSGFSTDIRADVIAFSGSLNTLKVRSLMRALHSALNAARHAVVFNFLCSPEMAGAPWLVWHTKGDILDMFRDIPCEVSFHDGYLDGDVTAVVTRLTPAPLL